MSRAEKSKLLSVFKPEKSVLVNCALRSTKHCLLVFHNNFKSIILAGKDVFLIFFSLSLILKQTWCSCKRFLIQKLSRLVDLSHFLWFQLISIFCFGKLFQNILLGASYNKANYRIEKQKGFVTENCFAHMICTNFTTKGRREILWWCLREEVLSVR